MDIIIGSGNNRQKVTFPSGYAMRKFEKESPIEYVKAKGIIMNRIRGKSE